MWWQGDWVYPTVRLAVSPSPGMVVAREAEVLDTASMRALREVSGDMSTLEFATETAQVGALAPGDVLLAAPSPTFPGGICRKVSSVGDVGGRVVVTTQQATLTDVIDQGEVAFRQHVTAADVSQAGVTQPGVRLVTDPGSAGPLSGTGVPDLRGEATDGFGFELTTTIAEKVEVEGSVWIDPDVYVDWEVGWGGVESAALTQTLSTSTDLTVSLKASLEQEIKQTIYKQTLAVITIMVGPVPVVVTPEFEVYVGASGEVTAGVTAGDLADHRDHRGISYDGDDWTPTSTFTYQITPQAPQLFGTLELKGFAGAGLAFKIYAVAGPEAKIEPFVKLEADVGGDPWWTLKAGVDTETRLQGRGAGHHHARVRVHVPSVRVRHRPGGLGLGGGGRKRHFPDSQHPRAGARLGHLRRAGRRRRRGAHRRASGRRRRRHRHRGGRRVVHPLGSRRRPVHGRGEQGRLRRQHARRHGDGGRDDDRSERAAHRGREPGSRAVLSSRSRAAPGSTAPTSACTRACRRSGAGLTTRATPGAGATTSSSASNRGRTGSTRTTRATSPTG